MPTPVALDPQLATPIAAGVVAAGLFLGAMIRGWVSKPKAQESKDAVVISGAFADAQPIRDLVAAVREQTQASKDAREATKDFDRNQGDRSRELVEVMRDVKGELRDIHEVVSHGVKIVPAGLPQ